MASSSWWHRAPPSSPAQAPAAWLLLTATTAAAAVATGAIVWSLLPPRPLRDRIHGPQEDEVKPRIDNEIYDDAEDDGEGEQSAAFWSDAEDAPLRLLNAARIPYFTSIWQREVGATEDKSSQRLLDVGCGGGVATEELAKQGFNIVGLDPAPGAIRYAERRAKQLGFSNESASSSSSAGSLSYVTGSAFSLPFPSSHFNGVVSSDVLEHLEDVSLALREIHRVLKPGGVFVFDTIHRTAYSWVTTILVAQKLLRYVPPDAHDWSLYITPEELRRGLEEAGFEVAPEEEWTGMGPKLYAPHKVLWRLLVEGKGRGSFFGPWRQSRWNRQASYLGWARKPRESSKGER